MKALGKRCSTAAQDNPHCLLHPVAAQPCTDVPEGFEVHNGLFLQVIAGRTGTSEVSIVGRKISAYLCAQGLKAGAIAGKLAKMCGGGGGGRPNLATAGGKDPGGIPAAIEAAQQELWSGL